MSWFSPVFWPLPIHRLMVASPSASAPPPMRPPALEQPGSPLFRALALAFLASVVVTTLYPFGPWMSRAGPALGFLAQGMPRYWTGFDVASNLLAYLLLGVLIRVSGLGGRRSVLGTLYVALFCAALSVLLETLQHWLPQRVPSLLDVLANSLGGVLGALLGSLIQRGVRRRSEGMPPLTRRWLQEGPVSGWLMLIAWLAVQAAPQSMLFACGAVRPALQGLIDAFWPHAPAPRLDLLIDPLFSSAHPAAAGVLIEAAIVMLSLGLIGTIVLTQVRLARRRSGLFVALGLGAFALNSLATQGVHGADSPLAWLTPGAQGGLLAGLALIYLTEPLGRRPRLLFGMVCALLVILLVNLSPVDRYFENSLAAARGAQWVNLHGLLRWLAVLWPFAAIAWLWRRL
jgi:VanZ family protein